MILELIYKMDNFYPDTYNRSPASVITMSDSTIENLRSHISKNTSKSYKSDLRHFSAWLSDENRPVDLPHRPETIADYISYLDDCDYAVRTIERRIQAISWLHAINDYHPSPTKTDLVRKVFTGSKKRRAENGRQTSVRSKEPATVDIIIDLMSYCGSDINGIRDKALLLIGWAGALRRSELVSLLASDITITAKGADIFIRRSKTDQTGKGQTVSITKSQTDNCPIRALMAWLQVSGIRSGYLFRRMYKGGKVSEFGLSDRTVANLVKHYCQLAGYNETAFSGHSLRSGLLTSAAENGSDLIPLAQHARHSDMNQTMHYIRKANRYKNNPTSGLL